MNRLLLFFVPIFVPVDALKILVYNSDFGYSHLKFMGKVADTLQLAGHEVTVLQPLIAPKDRGTGSQHAKVVRVPISTNGKTAMDPDQSFWDQIWKSGSNNPFSTIGPATFLSTVFDETIEKLMNDTEVLEQLKEEKFDLAIAELFDFTPFAVFHHLNLTNIVGAHSGPLFESTAWAIGVPVVPSYVPASLGTTGDNGSLWERILNCAFTFFSFKFQMIIMNSAQKYMDLHMPEAPKIWDTVSTLPFVLTNNEPLLDFPKPTLEKVIDLGGIGLSESKPLDEKWDSILNLRPQTVLISFGSVAPSSTMPPEMKTNIVNVMKKFPNVTFIWKYENPDDQLVKNAENVLITNWQPQTDLLADPRLSLFVTHGGAGSIMESAHFGVPLIVVPLFGDQMRNAQMVKRLGFGIQFKNSDLSDEHILEGALRDALSNEKLKSKAQLLKRMLEKKPFSPQEKLVRSINMAGEFGSMTNLSPKGRSLSFIQYFNIDIILLASVFLVLCIFLITKVVSIMLRLFGYSKVSYLKKNE